MVKYFVGHTGLEEGGETEIKWGGDGGTGTRSV